MKTTDIKNITTREDARQFGIDWQVWVSEQAVYYSELAEWSDALMELARKYQLLDEFKENGIL